MTAPASLVEEIERLAGGATAGPWQQSHRKNEFDGQYRTQVYDATGEAICTVSWYPIHYEGGTKTAREDNAAYIAAANPAAVLALIAELRAALAGNKELRKAMEFVADPAAFNRVIPFACSYTTNPRSDLSDIAKEWLAYIDKALAGSEGKVKDEHG